MTSQDIQQHIQSVKLALQRSQLTQANASIQQLLSQQLTQAQQVDVLYLAAVASRLTGQHQ